MKFDRKALIARIDEIEAASKAAHDAAYKPRLEAWEKAVSDYKSVRAPELAKQLRDLADKARRGQILDDNAIKNALGVGYNESKRNYRGFVYPSDPTPTERYSRTLTEKPKPKPYTPDPKMAALRALLDKATTDEYVTTSVLRELGFSPALFIKAVS